MNLSIIIPIYNVESYIEQCLISVLNQFHLNDTEILLIDDCGTDNSMDIARKIVNQYTNTCNIKIISHTHNQGLSNARNTGIKNAKGDYVYFLDSDDELPQNTIKIFHQYLSQHGYADFFIGNYIIEGNFKGTILNNSKQIYNSNDEVFNAYINNEWYVMACGKFINRSFLLSNKLWFPTKRLHEDEYFSFYLAFLSKKMIIINENVYIYKIRENSITTLKKRKNFIDTYWTYEHIIASIKEKNNKVYNDFLITILFRHALYISISKIKAKEKLVLLKWIKEQSCNINNTTSTIKVSIRKTFIHLPSLLTILLFKSLNHLFKWN